MEGFSSRIKPEDVPSLVKLARSYVLFGGRENITSVEKVLAPVLELEVRLRSGLLKKHYETKYLLLDGRDGSEVEVSQGIAFDPGVSSLVGLDQRSVEVVLALEPDGELTAFDLVKRVRLSEDLVRQALKELEQRRLALSYRRGRVKVYRRTVDVPRLKLRPGRFVGERIEESGVVEPRKITEEELRQIVRGLYEGGDLVGTSLYYYPLYRVHLVLGAKSRTAWIDARTGRQVDVAK
jgi:DNA-binding transcriptional ArsR family regulator